MSRNLGTRDCVECKAGGPIIIEEAPRAPTEAECGVYFKEYRARRFANAHCGSCEAQYLAWFGCSSSMGHLRGSDDDDSHVDLSYRSSFNDEYGCREDRAQYKIGLAHRRVRRLRWCRHGHRQLSQPVASCHSCRRAEELRDPRVADMLCVQFKYRSDGDWKVHYNSPLSDERAVVEASWIWGGPGADKPLAPGLEKRIARVRDAVVEPEEPAVEADPDLFPTIGSK